MRRPVSPATFRTLDVRVLTDVQRLRDHAKDILDWIDSVDAAAAERPAKFLATSGDPIDISGAAPPYKGTVLTAVGDGTANWQFPVLHYDPAIRFWTETTGDATIEPGTWGAIGVAPAGVNPIVVHIVSSITSPPVDSRFGLYVARDITVGVEVRVIGVSFIQAIDGTLATSCKLQPGCWYEWVLYHDTDAIWGLVAETSGLAKRFPTGGGNWLDVVRRVPTPGQVLTAGSTNIDWQTPGDYLVRDFTFYDHISTLTVPPIAGGDSLPVRHSGNNYYTTFDDLERWGNGRWISTFFGGYPEQTSPGPNDLLVINEATTNTVKKLRFSNVTGNFLNKIFSTYPSKTPANVFDTLAINDAAASFAVKQIQVNDLPLVKESFSGAYTTKGSAVGADSIVINDSAASNAPKRLTLTTLFTSITGYVKETFSSYTAKTTPVAADSLPINDSAAAGAMKSITVGSLPYFLTNLFSSYSSKPTPVGGDLLPLYDSAASGAPKYVSITNLATAVLGSATYLSKLFTDYAAKSTPVINDLLPINDSAASFVPKNVTIGALPVVKHDFTLYTSKTAPTTSDTVVINDAAAAGAVKRVTLSDLQTALALVKEAFSTYTQKTVPTTADVMVINDTAASNAMKRVVLSDLPFLAKLFSSYTTKATPVAADTIAINDSAASFVPKNVALSALPTALGGPFLKERFDTAYSAKASPTTSDTLAINDAAASFGPKYITLSALFTLLGGPFLKEFFSSYANKASPVGADTLAINDSAASFAPKYTTITGLLTSLGGPFVKELFSSYTTKAIADGTDTIVVNDSFASFVPKSTTLSNLANSIGGPFVKTLFTGYPAKSPASANDFIAINDSAASNAIKYTSLSAANIAMGGPFIKEAVSTSYARSPWTYNTLFPFQNGAGGAVAYGSMQDGRDLWSPYNAPLRTPNNFDDEFDSGGVSDLATRGWTFKNASGTTMTRVGDVVPAGATLMGMSALSASQYRSSVYCGCLWLQLPATANVDYFIYKTVTVPTANSTNGACVWARMNTYEMAVSGATNLWNAGVFFAKASAGNVDTNNRIQLARRFETPLGSTAFHIESYRTQAGTTTTAAIDTSVPYDTHAIMLVNNATPKFWPMSFLSGSLQALDFGPFTFSIVGGVSIPTLAGIQIFSGNGGVRMADGPPPICIDYIRLKTGDMNGFWPGFAV
jgi:hypothetical protein